MGDRESLVAPQLQGEAARVHGSMMPGAEDNKVLRLISATVLTSAEVMDVQPQQAATPRDFAAPLRAMQQLLPEHWCDHPAGVALGGARAHVDHLRVAGRLGNDGVGNRVDHPTWGKSAG